MVIIFFEFSSSLIDEYINLGIKFDNLILINNILNKINKTNDKINKLYFKIGLILILNGKLNNIENFKFYR